jgi:predicted nucleic acid-binding protein
MPISKPPMPKVLVDADVLFAAAASPSEHGASLLILRLAEITLVDAVTSQQVVTEAERNLHLKMPAGVPAFRLLVARCLRVLPDPSPAEMTVYAGCAQTEDLAILVTAVQAQCPWLVTFNIRYYQPGVQSVRVVRPGDFVLRIRDLLAHLAPDENLR